MINSFVIIFSKLLIFLSRSFGLGNGSTWPGHIALTINPHFIREILESSQTTIIMIAGTNGKTTTTTLIRHTLEQNGKNVFQNESGANLLNGIASSIINAATITGRIKTNFALFEVDENTLPLLLKEIKPSYLILLNLFRDQLDRYGEVHTIAKKWDDAISSLPSSTNLILNADDPEIAYLGLKREDSKREVSYFGLKNNTKNIREHAVDSIYCPQCGNKLRYSSMHFSHLGSWKCPKCHLKYPEKVVTNAPTFPLPGDYNKYNTIAANLLLTLLGLHISTIQHSFETFSPAFGRQEILTYEGKRVQIFLSKNPTSFNQSYKTIQELGGKTLLIVLNDRIPDGRDVSWIWDVDLPALKKFDTILISGDRVYDMALRIKYENYERYQLFENLAEAVKTGIANSSHDETLFILPTYSAMLEVRKILTGRKLL